MATYSGHIEIPYDLKEYNLKLDELSTRDVDFGDLRNWLAGQKDPKIFERIFRATTLLHHANAGTFEQCLETAIIWEVG